MTTHELETVQGVDQVPEGAMILPIYAGRGLTNRRLLGWCLIDPGDYAAVCRYEWFLKLGYVSRFVEGEPVRLHRELMGLEPGNPLQVHHINGRLYDNRRSNLEVVTASEHTLIHAAERARRRAA